MTRRLAAVLLLAAAPALAAAAGAPDPSIGPDPSVGPSAELTPAASEPRAPEIHVAPVARPKGAGVDYAFAVDPRIELLAGVVSLARPSAEGPRPEFAGLKDQPAVRTLKAALDRGVPELAIARLLLGAGAPPELAEREPARAGPFGDAARVEAFLAELRAFARAADWDKVWAARRAGNEEIVRRAREETLKTLSPEAVEAWFGTKFQDRYRFLLSDDLPPAYGCNATLEEGGRRVEIRLRSVMGWKAKNVYFSFSDFAGSAAHELTHTVTDPIVMERRDALAAYASLLVPGCTDSWTGCVLEHVDIATTLRALRAESGEDAYRAMLKTYSGRGFPYLPALCERLAEFEAPAVKAKGFAAFFPRVEDVFRDALRGKFRAQAKANVAAAAASAPEAAPEAFAEEFGTDPRLELASLLHRLAAPEAARRREAAAAPAYAARLDARFLRFASDPAVALTAKLEAAPDSPGLPASLLVYLSTGADLAKRVAVPPGYVAAAGGDEALDAWFGALRQFARASGFHEFYASERPYYAELERAARSEAARALKPAAVSAYLGRPLEGRREYALSPLYPSSYPARLTVFGAGRAQTLRARAARAGARGEPRFDLDADKTSTAAELIYEEAARLVPGTAQFAGSLFEACADRRGPGWAVCEREHLATAVRLRVSGAAPEKTVSDALPYLPLLLAKLAAYEGARAKHQSLASYWPEAEKAFGLKKTSAAETEADLAAFADFVVDPRTELVSVLLRLGGAAREKGARRNEEERLADARFAAFAGHPAVARTAALARAGGPRLPLRLALALDDAPELAERGLPPEPWLAAAGGADGFRAFAADLRAFSKDAGFSAFYDAARPLYRGYAAEARAEALRGQSPRAALAYLGAEVPRTRFLLSGLLPASSGADFELGTGTAALRAFVRPLAASPGAARFRFDAFDGSIIHEIVKAAVDPLVPERFALPGLVPRGCRRADEDSSWRACAREHLTYAVTLRLLAADAGEDAARIQTNAYVERGFSRLPDTAEKLREYEANRRLWPRLSSFAPRLLEAFAAASELPRGAGEAAEEPFSEEFSTDPRLELASLLHRLAAPPEARAREAAGAPAYAARLDARFLKFAAHPAVALTAKLEAAPGVEGLPASLIVHLSTSPDLARRVAVPPGYAAAAGGDDAVEAWFAEVRKFARESGFFAFYDSESAYHADLARAAKAESARATPPAAAAAYLGRPLEGRRAYALVPLYPPSYPARPTVFGAGRAQVLRARAARPGPGGEARFGLDSDASSTAAELIYDEAARLAPGAPTAASLAAACGDPQGPGWPNCEREHLAAAVRLRLRRAQPEKAQLNALPYLPALLAALETYESSRAKYPTLASYWPAAAKAFGAAAAAPRPAEPAEESFSERFAVDPRLELATLLHRLAETPEARAAEAEAAPEYAARLDGRFSAFAGHPAVALTAKLEAADGAPGLPANLLVHLSSGPELAQAVPVPSGYVAAAGGDDALEAWYAEVRKFARASGFFAFYRGEKAYYDSLEGEARAESARAPAPAAVAAYLGRPLTGRRDYALSPLYPASYPARLTVFGAGRAQTLRARAARADAGGAARFDLDSDKSSTAAELIYDEAARLIPGEPSAAGSLSEACADLRGPGWPICEREHLTAALRLRARGASEPDAAGSALLYLPALLRSLAVYEARRAAYPALADYWPEAEKVFGSRKGGAAETEADLAAFADFAVDRRVELAAVLLRLGGAARSRGARRGDLERAADQRFSSFAGHPAVKRAAALARESGPLPLRLALALGDAPELGDRGLPPEPWLSMAGGPVGFRAFASDLRSFAAASGFEAYLQDMRPLHRDLVAEARAEALRGESPRSAMVYLGEAPPRARFLLSGLLPAADAADFDLVEGGAPVRAFVRPAAEQNGPANFRFDAFGESVVHALLHAAVDPSVPEKFSPGAPAPKGCGGEGAPSWRDCAQEHLVNAVALRLLAADAGEEAARIQTLSYVARGYPFLPDLERRLKDYEKNRRRWPKFDAFAPELLDLFKSTAPAASGADGTRDAEADLSRDPGVGPSPLLGRDPNVGPNPAAGPNPELGVRPGTPAASAPVGFAGGIAAALADPSPCVLIAPPRPGPALAAAVSRFRRDRRLCDEELTGEQALRTSLKGRGLIVFGTPESNPWLKARWEDLQLPVRLEPGRVRLDSRSRKTAGVFEGAVAFVSAARNPEDTVRPVVVFAADESVLPGLLGDFSDAEDYEIRVGGAPARSGAYDKTRLPWRAP